MKIAIKLDPMDVNSIPFQEASLDIWDKKYRLSAKDGAPIDRSMDETYMRVARALADVEREEVREQSTANILTVLGFITTFLLVQSGLLLTFGLALLVAGWASRPDCITHRRNKVQGAGTIRFQL